MKKRLQRRSNVFLLEIILAIFFFSLASAVCIRLFAQAHTQSVETAALNQAILAASGAAEALEAWDGTEESMEELYPQSVWEDRTLHVYYDDSWDCCPDSESVYQMDVVLSSEDGLTRGDISVFETGGAVIYTLTTEYYRGNGI